MPFLQHLKEIQMLVLKEVVQYRIPIYFESRYVDFSKHILRLEKDEIVLEFLIKEKCNAELEKCPAKEKS